MQGPESVDSPVPGRPFIPPILGWALLLGLLVHLAGFFLFRVISNPLPDHERHAAFVSLLDEASFGGDVGLEEQALLFDTAPLFIPGRWSAASAILPFRVEYGAEGFSDIEPKMDVLSRLRPNRIALYERDAIEKPEDLLALQYVDLFRHFGQADPPVVALDRWQPIAEISFVVGTNRSARAAKLPLVLDVEPVGGQLLSKRPVVYLIGMYAAGMPHGAPSLKQSSGVDEIDAAVMEWLLRPSTLASLPAGYLEVRCYL